IRLRVAGPVRLQALSRIGTDGQGPTAHFAALVQTLARYCGPHILLFDRGDGSWLRIEADAIWSCDARPPDIRVPATLGGALVAFIAWSVLSARAGALATLGERIDSRVRGGGVAPVPESGPDEAVLIARAVNRFLEAERDRLEARADLLSTVSHDLGTPAARLKLRAALIEDPELRARFDRDIGLMTSMIDGVLAFTRNELDPEEPRRVSLLALVQAVVDDFADTGAPVTMRPFAPAEAGGASTVFGHGSRVRIDEPMRVLCLCRPAQITRALTNLVDNAVKYGQSAEISLTASAAEATIAIRDSGISRGEEELGALVGPFRRGLASEGKPGAGLGLSIVARIVQSHGGRLEFDRSGSGWIVRMTIPRGGHG
ncbi:MAG: sensor histidine kinase, partial [Rubricella sp.]